MKICLLGPTYPFRNGLYTTLLCHHLRKCHEVVFLSYKRQYPSLLYPGRSQVDHGQEVLHVESEPVFDPFNPLTWHRVVRRVRQEQADLLVFNWLTPFFAIPFAYIARWTRRHTSTRNVFICHNVKQHEHWPAEAWLTRLALVNAHSLIVHSEEDVHDARDLVPNVQIAKSVHPTYGLLSSSRISQEEARKSVELGPGRTLLFFGFVREYKGLRYLLEALALLAREMPDVHLLVVGEFWEDKRPYVDLIGQLGITERVTIVDEYIPDEDVQKYFAAAHLVVLPYTSATQSGVVQLAFGAGKPVVTTDVGGLPEAVEDGKTGFIVAPRDPEALAQAIARAFQGDTLQRLAESIQQVAKKFSWERLVETLEGL